MLREEGFFLRGFGVSLDKLSGCWFMLESVLFSWACCWLLIPDKSWPMMGKLKRGKRLASWVLV